MGTAFGYQINVPDPHSQAKPPPPGHPFTENGVPLRQVPYLLRGRDFGRRWRERFRLLESLVVKPSEDEVRRFLSLDKELSDEMTWTELHTNRMSLTAVESSGLQTGFLRCVCSRPQRRWKLIVQMKKVEVFRWEVAPPGLPANHRNPQVRPSDFPYRVRQASQEHHWRFPPGDTKLARPLPAEVLGLTFAETFSRFCEVVNIDPKDYFRDPPQEEKALFDFPV